MMPPSFGSDNFWKTVLVLAVVGGITIAVFAIKFIIGLF